jgi:ABC-type amino acid transport substrate-binding protein
MTLARILIAILCLGGAAQASTLDQVRRDGVLRVCIWPDYFGISHRNPRNGSLQGLDIDMSRALADELGARLVHVETNFASVFDDVEAGRCHVAMMGVGVTPERSARVDFSRPYLRSDLYAVTTVANTTIRRWEDIDQPGHVVSVHRGTVMERAMRETLRQADLRVVSRPLDRERDVESGRADVFITDFPYSRAILVNADWARVVEPAEPVRLTDYAYAVPKGDAAWLGRLDAFLARAKRDGTLEQAARRHGLLPIVVKD